MVLIFQMGKMLKRHRRHSAYQTPPSLLLTPPRIFAYPPRNIAHRHSQRPHLRSSSLLLLTRRNSHQHPPPLTQPLPPPTWSVVCRQSGDCPSLAWTRVSFVSLGRRTAASFTGELDTSFPATSAPGSWRRGTNCVRCAECRSSRSSSPTSAETDWDCPQQPLTTNLTGFTIAMVTGESVFLLSALFLWNIVKVWVSRHWKRRTISFKKADPIGSVRKKFHSAHQARKKWSNNPEAPGSMFGTIFSGGLTLGGSRCL